MDNKQSVNYCKYLHVLNIHHIDYSGVIDLHEGMARIEYLEKYFKANEKPEKPLKILMDARNYIMFSPKTHDALSKVARKLFHEKFIIVLAVLHSEHSTILSDKEAWFTSETEALNWLKHKRK